VSTSSGDGADVEFAVMGGCILMTLYGLAVIVFDAVVGVELVPHGTAAASGIMIACAVVGTLIGKALARGRG